MLITVTDGRLELGSRLQDSLLSFLSPIIWFQTFLIRKDLLFHFKDERFEDAIVCLKSMVDNIFNSITRDLFCSQVFGQDCFYRIYQVFQQFVGYCQ